MDDSRPLQTLKGAIFKIKKPKKEIVKYALHTMFLYLFDSSAQVTVRSSSLCRHYIDKQKEDPVITQSPPPVAHLPPGTAPLSSLHHFSPAAVPGNT